MQVSRVSSCASWASCLNEKDSMHFRPGPTWSLLLLDLLQRWSNGQQTWRGVAKLQQTLLKQIGTGLGWKSLACRSCSPFLADASVC